MSLRTLFYGLIVLGLTVGGFHWAWPKETPTFVREVWMPDASITWDPSLVNQWLEHPAKTWGFSDFRKKGSSPPTPIYKSVWVLATPLESLTKAPTEDWQILYLGSQGGQTIESTTLAVGDLLDKTETWTAPIAIGSVKINGSTVIIRTKPDYLYPFKIAVLALVVGLVVILILRDTIFEGKERRYFLRSPIRVVPPAPTKPPKPNKSKPAEVGSSGKLIEAKA